MSHLSATPRLRVAICGGGIGDVYEANSAFGELGAGIVLRSRTQRYLAELGIVADVKAINGRVEQQHTGPALSYFSSDKPEAQVMSNYYEKGMSMLHRAQFHSVLLRHVPKHVGLHTTKRLVSYSDLADADLPVSLKFADGSQASCDLLVGADGFRSTVRAQLLNDLASVTEDTARARELLESIPPHNSGAITYRTVIPREKLTQLRPEFSGWSVGKIYIGDGMFMVTYPIAQGNLLNTVIVTLDLSREGIADTQPWASVTSFDEIKPFIESAAPEPRIILQAIDGLELKKWVVNVVPPFNEWTAGRVALLGDAAHAMLPFQGAGAGQAIEDAQILSSLLGDTQATRATLKHVLDVYASVRKPVAAVFFSASRENGISLANSGHTLDECAAEVEEMAEDIWYTDRRPENDAQRALELFRTAIIETVL